eukprot:gene120-2352_t
MSFPVGALSALQAHDDMPETVNAPGLGGRPTAARADSGGRRTQPPPEYAAGSRPLKCAGGRRPGAHGAKGSSVHGGRQVRPVSRTASPEPHGGAAADERGTGRRYGGLAPGPGVCGNEGREVDPDIRWDGAPLPTADRDVLRQGSGGHSSPHPSAAAIAAQKVGRNGPAQPNNSGPGHPGRTVVRPAGTHGMLSWGPLDHQLQGINQQHQGQDGDPHQHNRGRPPAGHLPAALDGTDYRSGSSGAGDHNTPYRTVRLVREALAQAQADNSRPQPGKADQPQGAAPNRTQVCSTVTLSNSPGRHLRPNQ